MKLAIGLAVLQLSVAALSASQPDESDDVLDPVKTDNFWVPPVNALTLTCGGTSIKTGDGGAYTCLTVGESICRDNSPGSFGPGFWTFGISDGTATLYTPKNEISWQFCSDATHVCIGEDHGYDQAAYSQERPYLFFYDEKTQTYVGELNCDGTDGKDDENIGKPSLLKMVDLSDLGQYVDYGEDGIAVTKFKKGQTPDPEDNNFLLDITVDADAIGEMFFNSDKCTWTQTPCTRSTDLEDFIYEVSFDLDNFCAQGPGGTLTFNERNLTQTALLQFLNEDARCDEEGIIGFPDEIYEIAEIINFISSEEVCDTNRRLADIQEGRQLQRNRNSRRSRGRARGRGKCRRCKRRNRNNRKLIEIEFEAKTNRPRVLGQVECPANFPETLQETSEIFENVTEGGTYDYDYVDCSPDSPSCINNTGTCSLLPENNCTVNELPNICENLNITCNSTLNESCDPLTGECRNIEDLVPCIAVIDEDSSFPSIDPFPECITRDGCWAKFRELYPFRPFCLIDIAFGVVTLPTIDFITDPRVRIVESTRDCDFSSCGPPKDWLSLCGFNALTTANTQYVGLFVDDSGSMNRYEVLPSIELLNSTLAAKGISYAEVFNGDENWILPFLTDLVP